MLALIPQLLVAMEDLQLHITFQMDIDSQESSDLSMDTWKVLDFIWALQIKSKNCQLLEIIMQVRNLNGNGLELMMPNYQESQAVMDGILIKLEFSWLMANRVQLLEEMEEVHMTFLLQVENMWFQHYSKVEIGLIQWHFIPAMEDHSKLVEMEEAMKNLSIFHKDPESLEYMDQQTLIWRV